MLFVCLSTGNDCSMRKYMNECVCYTGLSLLPHAWTDISGLYAAAVRPGIELETELDSHSGKCEHLAKIYGSLLIIVELGVHKCFVEFSSNRVTEFPVNHKENGISKLRSQITDTDCRWHSVITFSDKNLLHRLQGDKSLCCVWEWKNSDFFFLD